METAGFSKTSAHMKHITGRHIPYDTNFLINNFTFNTNFVYYVKIYANLQDSPTVQPIKLRHKQALSYTAFVRHQI